MTYIKKIKLLNFKRFKSFSIDFDEKINILIGDNESGKSTILTALDIVLSGSRSKIETSGLDNLFNSYVVSEFLSGEKEYENLPVLYIEVYLDDQDNFELNGKVNSDEVTCDGMRLLCEPDDRLSKEIEEILDQEDPNFPFEYYSITFSTFSGELYSGYKRYMRHVHIDNTQISSEYATRAYIKAMYTSNIDDAERNKHKNEYRKIKDKFTASAFSDINKRIEDYAFTLRTGSKADLTTDLTISEQNINIENKGKGRQCFIKTEFALKKNNNEKDLDIILVEEPENHLSHINMKRLIRRFSQSEDKQVFIATHNNLICSRLDLRKSILLNRNNLEAVMLNDLKESTAKFFMKASNNNILEFVLSNKVILVEGDSEFILIEDFFQTVASDKLEDSQAYVISVGGTSFKRYLDLAILLNIKTAVIRDNDENYQLHCVENYSDYSEHDNIMIFFDDDNTRSTFEIALYQDNTELCDELFGPGRKSLTVQQYMLQNKADVAFQLLEENAGKLIPPDYIKEAIEWIRS